MAHRNVVLGREPLGDDRTVAGLRIALDAEQRRCAVGWQLLDDRLERLVVE